MRKHSLTRVSAACALMLCGCPVLPVERFAEAQGPVKLIPAGEGYDVLTEAVTTEFGALIELVRQAVREKVRLTPGFSDYYVDVQGMYADRAVVRLAGRLWSYPYTVGADNTFTVGEPSEVVMSFQPVKEALRPAAGGFRVLEAKDGGVDIEVTVIEAGVSGNGNLYTDAALKTLVPLLEGARVFLKSDDEHLKGGGKNVGQLLGGLYGARFAEGAKPDTGRVHATFKAISATDPTVVKMVEAIRRGLQGLMGLSIDAAATTRKKQVDGKTVREAVRFVKVNSVDLIVEPGAGGGLDRLAEAAATETTETNPASIEGDPVNKKRLLEALAAINAARAAGINADKATTSEVLVALQEACTQAGLAFGDVVAFVEAAANDEAVKPGVTRLVEAAKTARLAEAKKGGANDDAPVTRAELAMFQVRQAAVRLVEASGLPAPARERLHQQLDARASFTEADAQKLIVDERAYLARFTESGAVRMGGDGGGRIEVVGSNVAEMLEAFFDPAHKNHREVHSFRECYIAITGDRRVTGRLADCHLPTLREAVGALHKHFGGEGETLREAMDSTTLANALGNSLTRRMLQVYGQQTDLQAWRRVATTTSVNDFRTQERTTVGGYGNLPAVAEGAAYGALTSPGDLKASYAVTKRGGTESVTLEMIKNDDVGVIRRIPQELALAAANTLYEFVFDFFRTNPTIYDTLALYHATHNNLFTAALDATTYAAHRLAMTKFARLNSAKRRGVTPKTLVVPFDLQETAFNLFQRNQNLDKTFVQAQMPDVIVVPYWTDANDWCTVADPMQLPVLEIGFLDGREEPELFTQDMPNVGSVFSNDRWTWKLRHIYSGAVLPEGEKGTTKAVVP